MPSLLMCGGSKGGNIHVLYCRISAALKKTVLVSPSALSVIRKAQKPDNGVSSVTLSPKKKLLKSNAAQSGIGERVLLRLPRDCKHSSFGSKTRSNWENYIISRKKLVKRGVT